MANFVSHFEKFLNKKKVIPCSNTLRLDWYIYWPCKLSQLNIPPLLICRQITQKTFFTNHFNLIKVSRSQDLNLFLRTIKFPLDNFAFIFNIFFLFLGCVQLQLLTSSCYCYCEESQLLIDSIIKDFMNSCPKI